jgi:hypothetical protein
VQYNQHAASSTTWLGVNVFVICTMARQSDYG